MRKTNSPPAKRAPQKRMSAAKKEVISNTIAESILGFNPNPQAPYGTQLNQTTTLFKNNRWYLVSNMRQLLSEIYVEHGIIQTVVDVPVDDGFRGGIDIKTKQLEPEDIEEIKARMEREGDVGTVGQAVKWTRLFGGGGVLIMTDQEPDIPLDFATIKDDSPLEFRAVDMWELFWDIQNTEGFNPTIQEEEFEFYSYYGIKIHKSRVMKMNGLTAPSFIRPRLRGWGFSIVEALVNSINQYLKANNLIFEVLDEFKIDIYKIKNLTNTLLSAGGQQKVQSRIQLANLQKNYQNAVTMDSEDDFIAKELSFAGIAETMNGIRLQIASDLRMPLTKVFGISAAGFSSGEDDIENYNSMVESQVREKSKYHLVTIVELRCQQMFGFVPDDLTIEFQPLRMLSAEQEENVKTQIFTRLLSARQAGEISSLEFKDACNKENLLGIQVDTSAESLTSDEAGDNVKDGDDATEAKETIPVAKKAKKSVTEAPEAKS